MIKEISSQTLQCRLEDKKEFALLDIREQGDFIKGHLWLSINVPHISLQLRISRYVPRLDTPVILIDHDQSLASTVAKGLETVGYSNLAILRGGFNAWQKSGLPTITGDYVLAHAFGLCINQVLKTPSISANRLMQKLEAQEDILIIDSRDPVDFRRSTLPGAINVPIAEMIYRVPDLTNDEFTQIVVHCGGVTRGVLGAQTLIDAKLPNQVTWLLDGTTGWCIAGGELCRGKTGPQKPSSGKAMAYATKTARNLAEQFDLTYLEPGEVENWIRENRRRTCYLIDVRSHEEYMTGHYPNTINVPGGELVGMTQDHIATYNARLCLIGDSRSARAEITASWMLKNGWDDIVILKNWEHRSETGIPTQTDEVAAADDSSSKQAGKPERSPMSMLQASVDSRQHIFKSFLRDQPYRFHLTVSDPAVAHGDR